METRADVLNGEQISIGLATALTFDDVLLVPRHSQVLPSAVDVSSWVTRNIRVNVPLLSAAIIAFGTAVAVLDQWPSKLQWLILSGGSLVAFAKGVDGYLREAGSGR